MTRRVRRRVAKRRPGRPRKVVNVRQVEKLAAIMCSHAEIATVVGCSEDTLTRRFADAIKKGREQAGQSLKKAQFKLALGGNPTMLIWLGKQYLGQRDRQVVEVSELQKLSDAELQSLAAGRSDVRELRLVG
jgi:AraC-like DNA-binding protein